MPPGMTIVIIPAVNVKVFLNFLFGFLVIPFGLCYDKQRKTQRQEGYAVGLLLVEDDAAIVENLSSFLQLEGFAVRCAYGQKQAIACLDNWSFDLALVDLSLPDGDGFQVCARAKTKGVPVIFLTAAADEASVVTGLDMGADDYIAKPFRPKELTSRIRSVLRRAGKSLSVQTLGDLSVDTVTAQVTKGGVELSLSALEYRLLLTFLNHRGELLTRDRLLDELWELGGDYVNDNTLTVYIKRLREKIEPDPQAPALIRTVRGKGYVLET